jgi:hypothetical protein
MVPVSLPAGNSPSGAMVLENGKPNNAAPAPLSFKEILEQEERERIQMQQQKVRGAWGAGLVRPPAMNSTMPPSGKKIQSLATFLGMGSASPIPAVSKYVFACCASSVANAASWLLIFMHLIFI